MSVVMKARPYYVVEQNIKRPYYSSNTHQGYYNHRKSHTAYQQPNYDGCPHNSII